MLVSFYIKLQVVRRWQLAVIWFYGKPCFGLRHAWAGKRLTYKEHTGANGTALQPRFFNIIGVALSF